MNDINKMQEFIKALRNGNGYDWISRCGWELNKYELIDIIKELDYAIHNSIEKEDIYECAAIELADMYEDDEDYAEED